METLAAPGQIAPAEDSPRLTVVHVVTGMMLGGAEKQIEFLVQGTRHQASVVTLYHGGPVADLLVGRGHTVRLLGMPALGRYTAVPRLARLLRKLRPDVVHVHLLSAQVFGIPAARLAGVPVVVSSEHSIMTDTIEGRPTTRWLQSLYRLLERMLSHTIAVSPTTAERLREWGVRPERITVVDNGIDFDGLAFRPAIRSAVRTELGIPPQAVVFGAVGRLEPVKRFEPMIRGLRPFLQGTSNRLLVVGDGTLRDRLRELSRELGIADNVVLLGPRADLPRILNGFDLFVSTSRDETFGMAIVEAVANGLPVVYAECPAIDDIGLRLPSAIALPMVGRDEDAEVSALRSAVKTLLSDGPRRHRVPVELRRRYGLEAQVCAVDTLYEQLWRSRGTRHATSADDGSTRGETPAPDTPHQINAPQAGDGRPEAPSPWSI